VQKWELFRKFPFLPFKLSTLCRQLERPPIRRPFPFFLFKKSKKEVDKSQ